MKTFMKILGLNFSLVSIHIAGNLFVETGYPGFAILTLILWLCVGLVLISFYLSLAEKYIDPILDRLFSRVCKALFE